MRAQLWPTLCWTPWTVAAHRFLHLWNFQARILGGGLPSEFITHPGTEPRLPCLLHWRANVFFFLFFFFYWSTREAQMRGLSWPCSWQHGGDFLRKTIQISFSLRSWKRGNHLLRMGGWGRKASIMTGKRHEYDKIGISAKDDSRKLTQSEACFLLLLRKDRWRMCVGEFRGKEIKTLWSFNMVQDLFCIIQPYFW